MVKVAEKIVEEPRTAFVRSNKWSETEYSRHKLLLHPRKVESVFDVLRGAKEFDNEYPISVELHLTDRCNLKCSWCTDRDTRKTKSTQSHSVVNDLFRTFATRGVGVTIEGGGEPTIHPQFETMVEYGSSLGLNMGLITNGTKELSSIIDKFVWVRVSLDSSNKFEYKTEKGVNRFSRVMLNLRGAIVARGTAPVHLGVGYVITTRNIDGALTAAKMLDDIGVDYMYLRPVEEAPEITPRRQELVKLREAMFKTLKDRRMKFMLSIDERLVPDNDGMPCVAHGLSTIIRSDGTVMMCEKRRHDLVALGNVNKDSFDKIWTGDKRREVSQRLIDNKCQKGCATCRITPFNRIMVDMLKIRTSQFV